MYLVSSSRFSHPISRRALERHEVAALDAHLQRHSQHHGVTETTRIFDRQAEAKRTGAALPGEMAGEVAAARRELAGLFREQLYAAPQRAPPPALARGRGSGRAERDAARLARDEDEQLRRALAASLQDQGPPLPPPPFDAALRMPPPPSFDAALRMPPPPAPFTGPPPHAPPPPPPPYGWGA